MDPLTIAVGASALASIAQIWQSEKARGAAQDQLNQIKAVYNKIKPANYNMQIEDPPQLQAQQLQLPQFSQGVEPPKFDMTKLTPEDYQLIGKYNPQAASFIQEQAPKTIDTTAGMQAGRQAQMNALQRYSEIGKGAFDPQYQQAVTDAARQAQAQAQSRQASLLQDFARRGQAGSGTQLAAQIGAGSQATNNAAMTNLQAATNAYQNRLGALASGAQLGAQIQGQDVQQQQMNANIINDFNQRMTASRQQYENQRATMQNQAQLQNLNAAQNIASQNTGLHNQMQQYNQQYGNSMQQQSYQDLNQQQARQDALKQASYQYAVDAQKYGNAVAQQTYQNKVSGIMQQNALQSQIYQNQLGQAGPLANAYGQQANFYTQSGQDRNQIFQGLGNVGAIYGAQQMGADAQAQAQQNAQQNAATAQANASQNAMAGSLAKANSDYFSQYGQPLPPEQEQKIRQYYNPQDQTGGQ